MVLGSVVTSVSSDFSWLILSLFADKLRQDVTMLRAPTHRCVKRTGGITGVLPTPTKPAPHRTCLSSGSLAYCIRLGAVVRCTVYGVSSSVLCISTDAMSIDELGDSIDAVTREARIGKARSHVNVVTDHIPGSVTKVFAWIGSRGQTSKSLKVVSI